MEQFVYGITEKAVLIKYGEIALRGGNRKIYEDMLIRHIQTRMDAIAAGEYDVKKEQGRFLIRLARPGAGFDTERVINAAVSAFGIVGASPCYCFSDQQIENVKINALAHMREIYGKTEPFTFKVETTRADKRYPLLSGEISAAVGEFILDNMPNATVNVHEPMTILCVEMRNQAYIYSKTYRGAGGLPPGSSGKGILLLSGGFDSPVAGYLAAKRGVEVTAAYFHSPPYTSERAKEKVKDLSERISSYAGKFTLMSVPFTDIQLRLCDKTPPEKLTILLKRAMLKTAGVIAARDGALCVITGDSIGQVASQTLRSLNAENSAVTLPIIRPLACMDKQEIIDMAKKIGTYDISARPYDDCCTLFVAKHPETKPKANIIENIESKIELDDMINKAVDEAEYFYYN